MLGHPLVVEVRTVGLLGGVQLDKNALDKVPDLADRIVSAAAGRGVLLRALVGHTLQVSPPFVVREEELSLLATVLREALDATVPEEIAA